MPTKPKSRARKAKASSKSSASSSRRKKTSAKRPPWEKPAPKRGRTTKLSKAKKSKAKAAAKRAGRPYPNLVDNMRAASSGKRGKKRAKS